MISTFDGCSPLEQKNYDRSSSVVFFRTNEPFGGLSNMAGGVPLRVNRVNIRTSEALYQACRFPHQPEIQQIVLGAHSPMTAKMQSKRYRSDSRADWDYVRVKIMQWCLHVKLAQNWDAFSKLLLSTGHLPIVEQSWKDDFWGAKPLCAESLQGRNVLGHLLMELRESIGMKSPDCLMRVAPIEIPDFWLSGRPIDPIIPHDGEAVLESYQPDEQLSSAGVTTLQAVQLVLFDSQSLEKD